MEILKLALAVIGTIVGLITVIKGLIEYKNQGKIKKTEIFLKMRSRFREDRSFAQICDWLETDDPKLKRLTMIERDRFLGFFEELALIHSAKLINTNVALYMFGYYAFTCAESENFWYELNRDEKLWAGFFDFAGIMKVAYDKYEYKRNEFKL